MHGERLGDTYAGFFDNEVRALGLTLADCGSGGRLRRAGAGGGVPDEPVEPGAAPIIHPFRS